MQRTIERVPGFHDIDAAAYSRFSAALGSLRESFRLSGFAMMDVPILEQLELYLRKNGAQVLSKLYTFVDQGKREVALRPEFTASVIRAMAPQVGGASEPLRVAYAGPVFRYEEPRRTATREFTQAGVELLGDSSAAADAEVLGLACRAAREAGVPQLTLTLGHLGPLRALLAHLKVDGHAESYLLEYLEHRYRGMPQEEAVRRRLGLQPHDDDPLASDQALPEPLASALRDAPPEEARALVNTILDQMGLSLEGSTRTPDEIIDRVLAKARRQAALRSGELREDMDRALSFAERLSALRGLPADVLPQAEALLARYGVPAETLDELRQVLGLLEDQDLSGVTIELAPGMARGIAYYSGLIFELYAPEATPGGNESVPIQICGGGRYDGLARALTAHHSFPALGFAFGVEPLLQVRQDAHTRLGDSGVAILVRDRSTRRIAHQLAGSIRCQGVVAVVKELARGVSSAQEYGAAGGYAAVIDLECGDRISTEPLRASVAYYAPASDGDTLREALEESIRQAGLLSTRPIEGGTRVAGVLP